MRPGLLLLALLLVCPMAGSIRPASEKFRVVILTDMTHDDGNSLIRYLYYSPYFDTEAIIVTPQLPDHGHDDDSPWRKIQDILAAYREEYPQLRQHDKEFPPPASLERVTKQGRGALPIIWLTNDRRFSGRIGEREVTASWEEIRFTDWIGEGTTPNGEPKDSAGSEYLQEVFAREDDRPIHVQLWGGPITLVQALHRFEQRQGTERFEALLRKLHVYSIHLQDITADYFIDLDQLRGTPCAHLGSTRATFAGPRVNPRWFLFDFGHFWKYLKAINPAEVADHGPLSRLYDGGGEGDTPAFLALVSAALGLNDPTDPTQASWGNQFFPLGGSWPAGYFHTCPGSPENLMRWSADANLSFLARLQWSRKPPTQTNRAPLAVIQGDTTGKVLRLKVTAGSTLTVDASGSSDPDGDPLQFRWFEDRRQPGEASLMPLAATTPQITYQIPANTIEPIHLVLEVRDAGSPNLVSYRRLILAPSIVP